MHELEVEIAPSVLGRRVTLTDLMMGFDLREQQTRAHPSALNTMSALERIQIGHRR